MTPKSDKGDTPSIEGVDQTVPDTPVSEAVEPAQVDEALVLDAEMLEDVPTVDDPSDDNGAEDEETDRAAAVEPEAPTPAPVERSQGGGFVPLLFGGVLAGALGFGAAQLLPGDSQTADELAQLTKANAILKKEVSDLRTSLKETQAALELTTADLSALGEQAQQIPTLADGQISLRSTASALTSRVVDLENRPIPDVGATQEAVEAYETQLAGMRGMLADELDKIRREQAEALERQTTANATGVAAAKRAALTNLQLAVENGTSLSEGLRELKALRQTVPDVLNTNAKGVVTLPELQAEYDDLAREASAAYVKASAESGEMGRMEAFFRSQLGMRSVAATDDATPDAIMARAKQALTGGDLTKVLAELSQLPEPRPDALSDWMALAQTRQEVLDAVAAVAAKLN